MRQLQKMYAAIWVAFDNPNNQKNPSNAGEEPNDSEEWNDRISALADKIYDRVDAAHASLSLFQHKAHQDDDFLIPSYELCANDGMCEVRDGRMSWPISIFAEREINIEAIREFRDLVDRESKQVAQDEGLQAEASNVTIDRTFSISEREQIKASDGLLSAPSTKAALRP